MQDPIKKLQEKYHAKSGVPVPEGATVDHFKKMLIEDPGFRKEVREIVLPDRSEGDFNNFIFKTTGQKVGLGSDDIIPDPKKKIRKFHWKVQKMVEKLLLPRRLTLMLRTKKIAY